MLSKKYSPYINRFLQPDTIIPSPANPQAFNRYSYVMNRPTKFNDPSGHQASCDPDDEQCKDDIKKSNQESSLKYALEKKYKVKVKGNWTYNELQILSSVMGKLAYYVGGTNNLNAALLNAAHHAAQTNSGAAYITIERVSQSRWNSGAKNPSVAAWCGGPPHTYTCSDNTMVVANDALSLCYQRANCNDGSTVPGYPRNKKFTDQQVIGFTLAHEFGHILSTANPNAIKAYGGREEDMANELADHIISGGSINTTFSSSAAQYWNPNWQPSVPITPNLPNMPWE